MSAPLPLPLEHASVSYTLDEVIGWMGAVQHACTRRRKDTIRLHMAARLVVGRNYLNWPNKNFARPFAYPVADPRFEDEAFRRANTVRSLTRWQSFRAGLGFRPRQVTEQRLYDLREKNEPQASDNFLQRAMKRIRRDGIGKTIADRTNIDASAFYKLRAKHNQGLADARASFRKTFSFYLRNSLRIKEIMETEKSCLTALSHLHALKKEGVSIIFVDPDADFRRLFIEGDKIPYSSQSMFQRLNDYLATEARATGVKAGVEVPDQVSRKAMTITASRRPVRRQVPSSPSKPGL